MKIINLKLNEIRPYEDNAKKHPPEQVEQVANSIKEFGFNQPIVVDKDNVIVVGHGRYMASQSLGLEEVPVLVLDQLNENQLKAYRLADNKLNESDWNMELVVKELKKLDIKMAELTGFDTDLRVDLSKKDDNIPDLPEKPRSQVGDIYQFGGHRLVVGDSTNPEDIEKLMNGDKARCLFTSPPYNMDAKMYENYKDNLEYKEYIDFNLSVINEWKKFLQGFIFWNISYNTNTRFAFLEIAYKIGKETGMQFLELIVWNKKHAMPITSKKSLTRQYEDIFVYADEQAMNADIELAFLGKNDSKAKFHKVKGRNITNYWEVNTNNTQLDNHKACFPVELPLRGIMLTTEVGEIVTDPFLGSGSTMIACEKSGRKCYGMELDPRYADVIIQRYVDFTDDKTIIKNGEKETWEKSF